MTQTTIQGSFDWQLLFDELGGRVRMALLFENYAWLPLDDYDLRRWILFSRAHALREEAS